MVFLLRSVEPCISNSLRSCTRLFSNYKRSRPLVDKVVVSAFGGNGGNGAVSYMKYKSAKMLGPGIPNGGHGGRGGSVIVEATANIDSLDAGRLTFQGSIGAVGKKGIPGMSGDDMYVRVPLGTLVWELSWDPEMEELPSELPHSAETANVRKVLVADLVREAQSIVLAEGGVGGRGNSKADPHDCTNGEPGQRRRFELELRMLADASLVGFPNAGKSSLLGAVSRATPKVANYPFTTLKPFRGEVRFADGGSFTVADLPGLVEGAHYNRGLGFEFLRHAERTDVLVFVVDCSPGAEDERQEAKDPLQALWALREEVRLYRQDMANKPWVVVASKMDIDLDYGLRCVDMLHEAVSPLGIDVYPVSAQFGEGMPRLVKGLRRIIEEKRGVNLARDTRKLDDDEV